MDLAENGYVKRWLLVAHQSHKDDRYALFQNKEQTIKSACHTNVDTNWTDTKRHRHCCQTIINDHSIYIRNYVTISLQQQQHRPAAVEINKKMIVSKASFSSFRSSLHLFSFMPNSIAFRSKACHSAPHIPELIAFTLQFVARRI